MNKVIIQYNNPQIERIIIPLFTSQMTFEIYDNEKVFIRLDNKGVTIHKDKFKDMVQALNELVKQL